MEQPLQHYLKSFKQLKRGTTKYGPAPHKPVMLLSVLQSFQNKVIVNNQIYITPELVFLFKSNWANLVATDNVCNFALPFFHLKGEKFWHLIPKPGYEALMLIKESMSGFAEINGAVQFVVLNEDLYSLMKDDKSNAILQQFLLDEYFPDTKGNFSNTNKGQQKLFNTIEKKILEEDAATYSNEINTIYTSTFSNFQITTFSNWYYTCCISDMKIDAITNATMIDACHIVPFSESYDDTITNGISLCPNLHRAFDRGLITIDTNYKVRISKVFNENNRNYGMKQFEGKEISLPSYEKYYPLMDNFVWHREWIYKG